MHEPLIDQGLTLMLAGMGTVFAFLTVLVFAMTLMSYAARRLRVAAADPSDEEVAAISAASILAKTARDRFMVEMDCLYPHYAFAQNKGYGTEVHRDRLREHGPCALHRRSFAPVRAVL